MGLSTNDALTLKIVVEHQLANLLRAVNDDTDITLKDAFCQLVVAELADVGLDDNGEPNAYGVILDDLISAIRS